MQFISTHDPEVKASFKEAVSSGIAPDGGLFIPQFVPELDASFISLLKDMSIQEIAFLLMHPYVQDSLNEEELKKIIQHTFQFDIPIRSIPGTDIKVLELFHGPTWAFKDVGARFLAGCLNAWQQTDAKTVILVATSGDTGGAVANGFFNLPGIEIVVLYPKGMISPLQEQQIAGMGGNITALAVEGNFDDCQRLVRNAFGNNALRSKIKITSANSINVARWLPQMISYALAWKQVDGFPSGNVLVVPSGNYGNITAAVLLHAMGLQFKTFIAAHNANDTVPRFLKDGVYQPHETISTLANAMDVSDPGNFSRLQYLLTHVVNESTMTFDAQSVSDEQILETIRDVWYEHDYLLDPHTATAWYVLTQMGSVGVVVATAHPYKFQDVIIQSLSIFPKDWEKQMAGDPIRRKIIPADDNALNDVLMSFSTGS